MDEARRRDTVSHNLMQRSPSPEFHGVLVRRICNLPSAMNPHGLQRVRTFIEEHLHEQLELADLAAAVGISRFHFARLFRLATGESPMRYLLRMRIDRAKQLLSEPCGLIGDIALELGFYDQSHFTRSFRRLTGLSPTEFARQRAQPCRN